ncbi:MAG: 1-deoxy-D-xylulose-5-phosphate reductoisomerase [Christensenellales bacterium]
MDSEHSAIFQCLQGAQGNTPTRLILTASGGPFRTWKKEDIYNARPEQALKHPNWSMGRKITIDSASMMNKALEVIEARWLFDMPAEKIDVLIHPQSVIHSMVEYADGAVMAQLGTPDMRLPILYAMSWPERLPTGGKRLDFTQMNALTFEQPDYNRFPGLKLAYDALAVGGSMSAVLNGANEVAVDAFLHEKIPFGAIARLVEETMQAVPVITHPTLEQVFECDRAARQKAAALMSRFEA